MTNTDRIYIAVTENIKKYGIEHAVKALQEYITKNNNGYFTRDNDARKTISEVSPFEVMADILRTTLKYEVIEKQKGYAKTMPDEQKVMKAIYEYKESITNKIYVELNTVELNDVMKKMIRSNLDDVLNLLAKNPEIFNDYLSSYIVTISNHRRDLNAISNDNFALINEYFNQFEKVDTHQK